MDANAKRYRKHRIGAAMSVRIEDQLDQERRGSSMKGGRKGIQEDGWVTDEVPCCCPDVLHLYPNMGGMHPTEPEVDYYTAAQSRTG
jgi:hypothetical protein